MKARNYSERSDTVYFFGTCLMDAVYPDAGMAAIKLLESHGVEAVFPQDQSCCGQPAYNSGFVKEARTVARKQMAVFQRPYPVVVPSGGRPSEERTGRPRRLGRVLYRRDLDGHLRARAGEIDTCGG